MDKQDDKELAVNQPQGYFNGLMGMSKRNMFILILLIAIIIYYFYFYKKGESKSSVESATSPEMD